MNIFSHDTKLKNKNVLIMGLGTKSGGVQSAIFAAKNGARVTVTDLQNQKQLQDSITQLKNYAIQFELGRHTQQHFLEADIIIKNAGIKHTHPLLQLTQKNGAIIDTPAGIFTELVEKPYIGITGSKGKSFTTFLTAHLLHRITGNAIAVGNNCVSPLPFLSYEQPDFVMELSSWQLAELGRHKKSPHISCWLNFFPDHMNYYETEENYFRDKAYIFSHQQKTDIAILPLEQQQICSLPTKSTRFFFSTKQQVESGCYIKNQTIILKKDGIESPIITLNALPHSLKVPHFLPLILAACCCTLCHTNNPTAAKEALLNFTPPPHRFETLLSTDKFRIINDSAASTPDSVIVALNSIQNEKIILIAGGGGDKNLDYKQLANTITDKVSHLILFWNDSTSEKIASALPNSFSDSNLFKASSLEEATEHASFILKNKYPYSTLLLSPGCSGQPMFQDLFVRGEFFKKYVRDFFSKYQQEN